MLPLSPLQSQLVSDNLKLASHAVKKRLRRYHGALQRDDFVSAAHWGLIHAVTHYEQTPGDTQNKRWPSYAMMCMNGTMQDAINRRRVITVPARWLTAKGQANLTAREIAYHQPEVAKKRGRGALPDRWIWLDVKRAMNILGVEMIET